MTSLYHFLVASDRSGRRDRTTEGTPGEAEAANRGCGNLQIPERRCKLHLFTIFSYSPPCLQKVANEADCKVRSQHEVLKLLIIQN